MNSNTKKGATLTVSQRYMFDDCGVADFHRKASWAMRPEHMFKISSSIRIGFPFFIFFN